MDSADGVERLSQSCHDNLTVQSVEETLVELSPEACRRASACSSVQSYQDFAGTEFLESMLDAVGDVGRYAHLCLHTHIRRCCLLRDLFQQLYAEFLILPHVGIIIDHVDGNQSAVQFLVAHEDSEVDEFRRILWILHGNQHSLVVGLCIVFARHVLVANDNLLCRCLGDKCRDNTGEQNHDNHTIQHIVTDEVLSWCGLCLHAYHHDGDGTGSVSRRQTEHHMSRR